MHRNRENVLHRSALPPESKTVLEPRMRGGKVASPPFGAIRRTSEADRFPLSFAQERLWLLDQLEPGSSLYTIFTGLRLIGPLDKAALEWSLSEVLRRHETLRTNFVVADGQPTQVVSDPSPFKIEMIDLGLLPENERELKASEIAAGESRRSFDLARDNLLRVKLLKLATDLHIIIVAMPHIVSDGWSLRVLIGEVGTLYDAFLQGEP